jgi:hypothetical protein
MRVQLSEYFDGIVNNTKDAFCDMLNDPTLWSDSIIKETLKRGGSLPFNIEDVRHLIKQYTTVLSESIRTKNV